MSRCFVSIRYIFLFLIVFPLTGYAAGNNKLVHLTKERLHCLLEQVENLLEEGANPVVIPLSQICPQSSIQLPGIERERSDGLPTFKPRIDRKNPTLKPEDMLIVTRSELKCFKSEFSKLEKFNKEPIQVRFTESCIHDSDNKNRLQIP